MSNRFDIGGGHEISYYTYGDDPTRVGIIDWHQTPAGEPCTGGSVLFDLPQTADMPGARWQVSSMDPLTLSPSLLCRRCGSHGWIRDGAWIEA